jgi:hypothetical protein
MFEEKKNIRLYILSIKTENQNTIVFYFNQTFHVCVM